MGRQGTNRGAYSTKEINRIAPVDGKNEGRFIGLLSGLALAWLITHDHL
jgi:hypothetical protein